MRVLAQYTRIVDRITEWIGHLSVYLVVITVVIGFYNVVVRYLGQFTGTQLSSNVYIELQWYLFSLVFFLGFAYILKNGINVRVDFIYANWPAKRKARLDFWGHLLFLLPFCILGIYVTISPVLTSWGRLPSGEWGPWEQSPDPSGLPRAPIKTMILVGFGMLLAQTIAELVKLWAILPDQQDKLDLDIELDREAPLRVE